VVDIHITGQKSIVHIVVTERRKNSINIGIKLKDRSGDNFIVGR